MCVYFCACTMEARGQLWVSPQESPTDFLRQSLSLTWNLTSYIGCPASKPQASIHLCLPSARTTGMPPCLAISQGSWGSNRGLHAYRRACYRLPLLPFFHCSSRCDFWNSVSPTAGGQQLQPLLQQLEYIKSTYPWCFWPFHCGHKTAGKLLSTILYRKGEDGQEGRANSLCFRFHEYIGFHQHIPIQTAFYVFVDERPTTSDSSLLYRDVKVIITHSWAPRWFPG